MPFAACGMEPLPSWAELAAAENAQRVEPCEAYALKLQRSVRERRTAWLSANGHDVAGGLEAQQAIPIKAGTGGMQTFNELWHWGKLCSPVDLARPLRSARECVSVEHGNMERPRWISRLHHYVRLTHGG